jgi:hypothetical protein
MLRMRLNPYHAKYYAHDLTRRVGNGVDRLSMTLFDVAVDLNPHQAEGSRFVPGRPACRFLDAGPTGLKTRSQDSRGMKSAC